MLANSQGRQNAISTMAGREKSMLRAMDSIIEAYDKLEELNG